MPEGDGSEHPGIAYRRTEAHRARVGEARGIREPSAGEALAEEYVKEHVRERVMDDATRQLVHQSLAQDRVCSLLDAADLVTIVDTMQYFTFEMGEQIITQGRTGQYLFITQEGIFEVSMNGQVVNTMSRGSVFGGLALLYKCPRTATVSVKEAPAGVWGCDGDTFHRVIEENAKRNFEQHKLVLDNISLFNGLSPKLKEHVGSSALFGEVVEPGTRVVTEGEICTAIYFVKKGELRLVEGAQVDATGATVGGKEVRRMGAGEVFGERAALYGELRNSTVLAETRCELLCIGIEQMKEVLGEDLAGCLERSLICAFMRSSPTFSRFTSAQHMQLVASMKNEMYAPNASVEFRDPVLFVVCLRGEVSGRAFDGSPVTLQRGSFIEEPEAGLPGGCQGQPVLATGPEKVKLAFLTREGLAEALRSLGISAGESADGVLEHQRKVQLAQKTPIFRHLSPDQLDQCARSFVLSRYATGATIIRQGEIGTTFFGVAAGEVRVVISDEPVRVMGRGAYFGERALLFDEPRTATVEVASAEAELWSIEKQAFAEIAASIREDLEHRVLLQNTSVKLKDLKHRRVIGVGGMGSVRLVEHKGTGLQYALKRVKKTRGKIPESVVRECALLGETCDHPFVLQLVKTFETQKSVYILTELIFGGELFSAIRQIPTVLSRRQAMFYVGSLVLVLELLGDRGIVFRDFKPENVMLDSHGYLKLIDFGIAKKLGDSGEKTFTIVGTPHYMAPEVMRGRGYGVEVDIWSLGVMLFEFVCGFLPFGDEFEDPTEICTAVCSKRLEFPAAYDDQAGKKLMQGLLTRKVEKRLGSGLSGYDDIKESKFFKTTSGNLFSKIVGRELEPPLVPAAEGYCDPSDAQDVSLSDAGELCLEA